MIKKKGVFIVCCVVLISFAFTLGVSQADSSWKFAFMGDNKDAKDPSGVNLTTVGRIAADMAAQKVSLVIAGGDLIDGRGCNSLNCGTDTVTMGLNDQYKAWMNAMAPVYNAGISVYAIPGNHEYWCDNNDSCVTSWIQTVVPNLPAGIIDNPSRPGREYSFIFFTITGVRTCRWPWSARTPVRCSRLSRVRSSLSRTWVDCITILRGWLHDVRGRELHRNAQYAFSGRTTPRGDTPAPISSGRQSSARRLRRPPASRARGDRQSSRCRS